MKQASFIINTNDNIIKKNEIVIATSVEPTSVEPTSVESKKVITSKKPQKLVENIYYFR